MAQRKWVRVRRFRVRVRVRVRVRSGLGLGFAICVAPLAFRHLHCAKYRKPHQKIKVNRDAIKQWRAIFK